MAKRNRIPIQPLVSVLTLSINLQKNGIEIRFPGDPGQEVREILTENGWRFNPYGATSVRWQDPTWYKRYNPDNLKFARDLVVLLSGMDNTEVAVRAISAAQATQPTPAEPPPSPVLPLPAFVAPPLPAIAPSVPKQLPPAAAPPPAPVESAAPVSADPMTGTVEIRVPRLAA